MKLLSWVWPVTVVALLAGCQSAPVKLDKSRYASIKVVSVDLRVEMPTSGMYLSDQAEKTVALGLMAVPRSPGQTREVARKMMESNDVNVDSMLRDEFIEELRQSNKVAVVALGPADAHFRLTITKYGLSAIPWHSELQPVVAAKAELVMADGTIVWSFFRDMNNHSDNTIPALMFDSYAKNGELLRRGFLAASTVVAKDLVGAL